MLKRVILACIMSIMLSSCQKKEVQTVTKTNTDKAFVLWTTTAEPYYKALLKEFQADEKLIKLSTEVVFFPSDEALEEQLVDSMAEGNSPDVVLLNADFIDGNKEKLTPAPASPGLTPELFRDVFVRATHTPLLYKRDDGGEQIIALPMSVDSLGIYYNDEHLNERLPDKNEPANTWLTMIDDTTKLTKQDNSDSRFFVSGLALGRTDNTNYTTDVLYNIFLQRGVELFSEDGTSAIFASRTGTNEQGVEKNLGIEAVSYTTSYADSRYKHYSWNENTASEDSIYKDYEAFVEGKVSMVFGYSSDYNRILELIDRYKGDRDKDVIVKESVRTTYLPQINDPNKSLGKKVLGRIYALAVPKNAVHSDLAWRFIQYAIKEDNLSRYHKETLLPTPRVLQINEQAADPHTGIFARQAKYAEYMPIKLDYHDVYEDFEEMIDEINSGSKTPEYAIKELQNKMTTELREKKRLNMNAKEDPYKNRPKPVNSDPKTGMGV